jgi:hypothetical protein
LQLVSSFGGDYHKFDMSTMTDLGVRQTDAKHMQW